MTSTNSTSVGDDALTVATKKMNAFFFAGEKEENKAIKLPGKLMYILKCGDYNEIIFWSLNGKAIVIKDAEEFVKKVLPVFSKQSKFASFTRKMRRWGFSTRCLHNSGVHWAFQHPHFSKAGGFTTCNKVITAGAAQSPSGILLQMKRVNIIAGSSNRSYSMLEPNTLGRPKAPAAAPPVSTHSSQIFNAPEIDAATSEWLRAGMYASARNNAATTATASNNNMSLLSRSPELLSLLNTLSASTSIPETQYDSQRSLACLRESTRTQFITTRETESISSIPHLPIIPTNMSSISMPRRTTLIGTIDGFNKSSMLSHLPIMPTTNMPSISMPRSTTLIDTIDDFNKSSMLPHLPIMPTTNMPSSSMSTSSPMVLAVLNKTMPQHHLLTNIPGSISLSRSTPTALDIFNKSIDHRNRRQIALEVLPSHGRHEGSEEERARLIQSILRNQQQWSL